MGMFHALRREIHLGFHVSTSGDEGGSHMHVTPPQEEEIHDLITRINKRSLEQESDIRNLYNLIHVCMGEGVRFPEYRSGNE
jgi:hypothetical protein